MSTAATVHGPKSPRLQNRCIESLTGKSVVPYIVIGAMALLLRVWWILTAQTYDFPEVTFTPPAWIIQAQHFTFGYETGSIAHWLAEGKGFASPFACWSGPTAWIAPIYPSILAGFFLVFGIFSPAAAIAILIFNSVCSALTCITIGRIAEKLFRREVGLCAAIYFAAVPYFWRWPTTWVWEMPLSGLMLTSAILLTFRLEETLDWKSWVLFGAYWGLCGLTNPTMLSVLPIAVLWAWWRASGIGPDSLISRMSRQWKYPVLVGVAFLVTISPWLVRNYLVFGRPVFIRGNAPAEIWFYNYPGSPGTGFAGRHPTQNRRELAHYLAIGEVAYVAEKKQMVLQDIHAAPNNFLASTWSRVSAFWSGKELDYQSNDFWNYQKWQVQLLSSLALLGFLLARYRNNPNVWLVALAALAYPLAYYITFVQPRYRHPVEPLLLVFAFYFIFEQVILLTVLIRGVFRHGYFSDGRGVGGDS